jgi:hypothetical protein
MNALVMIAHCGHHQSAPERPFCRRCNTATVLSGGDWICPECLIALERRPCPYCAE